MKGKLIWSIFWAMFAVFVIAIGAMFADVYLAGDFPIGYIVIPFWVIFTGLGATLIVLTLKRKIKGVLKYFLLLTGSSAAGFIVFVLLHNIVSVLFNIEEAVFFVLATIVSPAGFLVGAIGIITLAVRNKPAAPAGTS
jgi:hypothetical protein